MLFRRRTYFIFTGILLILSLSVLFTGRGKTEVREGVTVPLIPAGWRSLIVRNVNSYVPEIRVNGSSMVFGEALPYVAGDLDVMLPVEVLRKEMEIHTSEAGELLTLIRGERILQVNLQTDEVTLSGETGIIAGAGIRRNGHCYISADLLSRALGLDYRYDTAENAADFIRTGENILPAAFSLLKTGMLPEVQDQGNLGSCWAFAALSAMELSMPPEGNVPYSRDHLLLHSSTGYQNDGDSGMALSYLLSWQGPVSDPEDVYGDGITGDLRDAACHLQEAEIYEEPDIETVKRAVFLKGGTTASLYLVMADPDNLINIRNYYNEDTASYCYTGEKPVNHEVLIVGWDDHYSRENFTNTDRIREDGAFLCMNSWGQDFGQNGLFWISYEDSRFLTTAVCYCGVEKNGNYDRIYQSDLRGATANAGFRSDTVYFASVYTAAENSELRAAGFYTLGQDSEYTVWIVEDYRDERSLLTRRTLCSGTVKEAGFHTVTFRDPPLLEQGERFAVVVKLKTPGCEYPAAIEKATSAVPDADISDGESYLSSHGTYFRRAETESGGNVCLKAYTVRTGETEKGQK